MCPLKSNTWRGCQRSSGLFRRPSARSNVFNAGRDGFWPEAGILEDLQLGEARVEGKPIALVFGDRLLVGGLDRAGGADEHLEVSERRLRPEKLPHVGLAFRCEAHRAGRNSHVETVARILRYGNARWEHDNLI